MLDNLAAFTCNKDAMPWHVKLKSGTVQIADQGSGAFAADIATATGGEVTRLLPSAAAQRGILNQWDLDPTTEAEELELLGLAYRKATDPTNPEVDTEIYKSIGELCVRFDILPTPKTLSQILTSNNAADKVATRRAELASQIPGLHLELARIPTQPTDDQVKAERKKVEDAEQRVKEAKTPEEKAKALAEPGRGPAVSRQAGRGKALRGEEPLPRREARAAAVRRGRVGRDRLARHGPLGAGRCRRSGVRIRAWGIKGAGIGGDRNAEPPGKDPLACREEREAPDQKSLLLTAISIALDSYVPSPELREATQRNVGLVAQAEDKVRKLEELVEKFNAPWLACGKSTTFPSACYRGRHCGCTGDSHVWVMPDRLQTLKEFTLIVLALAPIEKQEMFPSRGAAFSPSLR
ncbi:MAG: hypothetical protein U0797_00825 [Gemmataceae bacterium]